MFCGLIRKQCLTYRKLNIVCMNKRQFQTSKNSLKFALLDHRAVVEITGKDSVDLLQGLLTNDITRLTSDKAMYSMMLTANGRVDHDLILYQKRNKTILLDCELNRVEDLIKSFKRYKLRKKAKFVVQDDMKVWQFMRNNKTDDHHFNIKDLLEDYISVSADPRVSLMGYRVVSKKQPFNDNLLGKTEDYHNLRYELGIPEGAFDLLPGKCLPLESNIDFMHGINFHKGCYLGQELTARTHHTGVIRKRLVPVKIQTGSTPDFNSRIKDQKGKNVGKYLASNDGKSGLALMKLTHLNEILVCENEAEVVGKQPAWWHNKGESFSDGYCEEN